MNTIWLIEVYFINPRLAIPPIFLMTIPTPPFILSYCPFILFVSLFISSF